MLVLLVDVPDLVVEVLALKLDEHDLTLSCAQLVLELPALLDVPFLLVGCLLFDLLLLQVEQLQLVLKVLGVLLDASELNRVLSLLLDQLLLDR